MKWSTVKATALFLAAANLAGCGKKDTVLQDIIAAPADSAATDTPQSVKAFLDASTRDFAQKAYLTCAAQNEHAITQLSKANDPGTMKTRLADMQAAADKKCVEAIKQLSSISQ